MLCETRPLRFFRYPVVPGRVAAASAPRSGQKRNLRAASHERAASRRPSRTRRPELRVFRSYFVCGASRRSSLRRREVKLHIYDFKGGTSSFLSSMGVGLHHSGVEVSGREYSFNDEGVRCRCF